MLKSKKLWLCIAFVLTGFILWIAWGNTALELNHYTISSDELPSNFKGYRIALVTDLHNCEMGENNTNLLEMLEESNPDMIAIVGDIVDCYKTNIQVAIGFAKQAVQIAPTYYVTGNHESFVEEYDSLETGLTSVGVTVLHDEFILIEKEDTYIQLIGLDDPSFSVDYFTGDSASAIDMALSEIEIDEDAFTLLLGHRPELFDVYVKHDINLVLSGHAHGGQFRLPFVGGLYSPNQGIFPKYDAGLFTENETNMIVSRGIGNSQFPVRFNNRPEVILIELE